MNQNAPVSSFETAASMTQSKWAEQVRSGSGWIFIIAALSVVNSAISIFGGSSAFVVGLGVTQIVDVITLVLAEEYFQDFALVLRLVGVVISLGVSGVLALFGYFARKGQVWAFALIFLGYGFDTLVVLFFQDWLSGIFHALGLFYIGRGAYAAYKFNQEMKVIR